MAAKRRKKATKRPPAKRRGSKPAGKSKAKPRGKAPAKVSAPYSRSRAMGLPPVPPGFVGAIVDSLIRNDGARDVDVRCRDDGNFDVVRVR
jgi:hypothetical protein